MRGFFRSGGNAFAFFLLAASLMSPASASETVPAPKNISVEIPAVSMLRPWELRRLSALQKLNYYRALQSLMTSLETATTEKGESRNALHTLFMPRANAMVRSGDDCVIGGYMSQWYRAADGHLSCAAPKDDQILDAPAPGQSKSFYCGGGEKSRTAYCNSAAFLYAQDNGERFCQPLENFSSNCKTSFESRYGRQAGGDPNFPERLNRDIERFSRTMSPDELNKYYGDVDAYMNRLVNESKFDKKSAETIRSQIAIINKTRATATAPAPAEGNSGARPVAAPGATTAAPAANAPNNIIVNASANASAAGGAAPTASGAPATAPLVAQKEIGAALPPAVDPAQAGAPQIPRAEDSKILGKELSCVRDGLKSLGYSPSERFLALIGTSLQASMGAYDSNQDTSRQMLQSRVISMVQAYGFCDEKSYPSSKMKPHDIQLARRWLNSDGGKAQARPGLSYLSQMIDPAATASRKFYEVYGMRAATPKGAKIDDFDKSVQEALSPFMPEEKSWSALSLADRQEQLVKWSNVRPGSDFAKCHKNASDLRSKDRRFKLKTLRAVKPGPDGKRPTLPEAQKTEVLGVQKATKEICEAMARACSLDPGKTCGTEVIASAPTMSPGLDGQAPVTSPPAAPAGTAGAPARQ